jgi:hypothetical protein
MQILINNQTNAKVRWRPRNIHLHKADTHDAYEGSWLAESMERPHTYFLQMVVVLYIEIEWTSESSVPSCVIKFLVWAPTVYYDGS